MFYHKNFSRGCAPHPLSLKTRFSLYHIKVLHLFANRLSAQKQAKALCTQTPHTETAASNTNNCSRRARLVLYEPLQAIARPAGS